MDTPATRKQLTHDRILDTAAGVLREDGFWGVGVADIMKRSGLTHGGFYAHFASRDALLAEALERAGEDSRARLLRSIDAAQRKGASRFRALIESYLSNTHLAAADRGCPVAALASEMARQSEHVREAAAVRVEALVELVRTTLAPSLPDGTAAIVTAQMLGALQLARALGDNAAGRRHLEASRRFLLEQFDSPPGAA